MKEEYNFSNGERGRFYNKNAIFHLPNYLKSKIANFIKKFTKEQKKDETTYLLSSIQNRKRLLRSLNNSRAKKLYKQN